MLLCGNSDKRVNIFKEISSHHRKDIPTEKVDIMLFFQRPLFIGSLPEFFFDTMGMTSEECLKANFAFELFLFYSRYPGDSFKVVGIQFKYKSRLESTMFDVSFHLHLFC